MSVTKTSTGYVSPTILTVDGGAVVAALGPASAYGPPPCQTSCPMCANFCGGPC